MVQVNYTEAKFDVALDAGDGWSQTFAVTINGAAASFTGATVTCTLTSMTGGSTGVTVTPVVSTNTITLALTGANTTTLAPFKVVTYTLQVTPSGGQRRTYVSGFIYVYPVNSGILPTTPGGTVSLSILTAGSQTIAITAYLYGATGISIVTSGTRPGSPFTGQQIYETDTLRYLVWDGTAWQIVYGTTPWITVGAFLNSWVNFGGTEQVAQYRKVNDIVYLRGAIKSGTLTLPAFTLPAGFRPPASLAFAASSAGAFGNMSVATNGDVTPANGSTVSFNLNNAIFSITA